jgi:hypothetical protein
MSVRSQVDRNPSSRSLPFPKLMISRTNDLVVLMTAPGHGTVVGVGSSTWFEGDHKTSWMTEDFDDFQGTVTLSNEELT